MADQSPKDWFIGKARTAAGYRKNIIDNEERSRISVFTGRMYFFYYLPKGRATLPMYDKFPMVFPIERRGDGFIGLNLHYLQGDSRAAFLERMKIYRNNDKYDESTKLRISYQILKHSRANSAMKQCIKKYLFTHVLSPFIEINADEWDKVLHLPVDWFVTN